MPYDIPGFPNYILYDNLDVFSKTSNKFLKGKYVILCNNGKRKAVSRPSLRRYIPLQKTFKDIPSFDGEYGISRDGDVYSYKSFKVLKSFPNKHRGGYAYITLHHNGESKVCKIHRLVAETYIPNPDKKPCVNHIDGNVLNNSVENLEWCTTKENNEWNVLRGTANGGTPMKCALFTVGGEFVKEFRSIKKASEYVKANGGVGYDDIEKRHKNKEYVLEVL